MSKVKPRFGALVRLAVLGALAVGSVAAAIEPANVTFDFVRAKAEADAAQPYAKPENDLPESLAALTYDQYRDIRFKPSEALWREEGLPFQLQFFHRGGLFRDKVTIREFSATHEQVIPFMQDFFSYGQVKNLGWLRSSLGYAGFRVHAPLNRPDYYDEVIAFLGTSYFRAIGAQQIYGLSSRGVALNCGVPGEAEEFPRFTDFWVGKPAEGDTSLIIYALLKGPSVTGAYEFTVRPGKATVVEVRTELIFRRAVTLPGVAPLTSMFWYGENSARPGGQLRQEVHDSDGLIIEDAGGRHLWQPLQNPSALEVDSTPVQHLTRFGLMQRDRRIADYEDLEAHYEQRPSAWIEPEGDWGEGSIRLVQLPTSTEYGDNIVAFWVPAASAVVGRVWQFSYRIVWSLGEPAVEGRARVAATREGDLPGVAHGRLFWIDFTDESFASRAASALEAEIVISDGGRVRHKAVSVYPQIGGWRVALEVEATQPGQIIHFRCQLHADGKPISETWVYAWKS
ncbi:MAG: glucan biosynthesis protein G [Opitutaceae bacterium]